MVEHYACDSVLGSTYCITTTLAGEWLKSLILHGNIKCITANGYIIIYAGANCICHGMILHFMQKNLGSTETSLIYTYGFAKHNMIGVTVSIYGFAVIHSVPNEITL